MAWLASDLLMLSMMLVLAGVTAQRSQDSTSGGHKILQYQQEGSSRQEQGSPGKSVTGQYSWTDANGQRHRIWYIADENGFQAFGDLVPKVQVNNPGVVSGNLGLSVSTNDIRSNEATHSSSSDTNNGSTNKLNQGETHINSVPSNIMTKATNSKINDAVVSLITDGSTLNSESVSNQEKPLLLSMPNEPVNTDNMSPGEFSFSKISNAEENIINTNEIGIQNEKGNVETKIKENTAKMISGDRAGDIHDLFHGELPNPIDGTAFTLIDRLQPPTEHKPRTSPTMLRPQLVGNRGPVEIISGLHTSKFAKHRVAEFIQRSTTLGPHLTRGKAIGRVKVVPKPLKVEGTLNYDDFYIPANIARMTPAPFQLGNLADYYYDYDYYDDYEYPTTDNITTSQNSTSNPVDSIIAAAAAALSQSSITEVPAAKTVTFTKTVTVISHPVSQAPLATSPIPIATTPTPIPIATTPTPIPIATTPTPTPIPTIPIPTTPISITTAALSIPLSQSHSSTRTSSRSTFVIKPPPSTKSSRSSPTKSLSLKSTQSSGSVEFQSNEDYLDYKDEEDSDDSNEGISEKED